MLLTFWNRQNQKRKAHAKTQRKRKDKSNFNAFMNTQDNYGKMI